MASGGKQYTCPLCNSRRVIIDDMVRNVNGKKVYDPIWICEDCDYIGFIDLGDKPKGWKGGG